MDEKTKAKLRPTFQAIEALFAHSRGAPKAEAIIAYVSACRLAEDAQKAIADVPSHDRLYFEEKLFGGISSWRNAVMLEAGSHKTPEAWFEYARTDFLKVSSILA